MLVDAVRRDAVVRMGFALLCMVFLSVTGWVYCQRPRGGFEMPEIVWIFWGVGFFFSLLFFGSALSSYLAPEYTLFLKLVRR